MRFVLPLLLVPTAALADTIEPAGALDSEVLRGTVLVWHDAAFYTAPADDAPAIHVAALGAARKERVGHVVPMHVLGTRGAFVEVEPAEADCTWSRFETSDDIAKLKLYVKRADLAPVLIKPFDKAFADGTKLALRPGVALVPAGDGVHALSLGGDEFEAEIPAASIGHAYTPERAKPIAVSAHEYKLTGKTAAKLGDRTLALANRRAVNVDKRGDSSLFTIDERCATVTVSVATKAVRQADDDDETDLATGGGGFGVLGLRDSEYLPALTQLSTPAGQPIAYAAKPIYLAMPARSKTVCFDRRVRLATPAALAPKTDDIDDDKLRLCAPATKVAHEKLRSSSSANGTTGR